jgi:hypothetical protein
MPSSDAALASVRAHGRLAPMRTPAFLGLLFVVACGSSQGNPLDDAGADGTADATSAADASDASSSNDATSSSDAADAQTMDVAADAPPCPTEKGAYSLTLSGQGCGSTSTNVQECINQTGCTITIVSSGPQVKGVDGTTPIQGDGSFTNASMNEGHTARTGCTGTWNNGVLVVDCGGVNTSQSCIATLTQTSPMCN